MLYSQQPPTLFAEERMLRPPPCQQARKQPPTMQEFDASKRFQEWLHGGIHTKMYRNGNKMEDALIRSLGNCRAILCVYGDNEKEPRTSLDIRNMEITEKSLRAEAVHPELEMAQYIEIQQRQERIALVVSSKREKQQLRQGLQLLQRIYNAVELYDEQLDVFAKEFCLQFADSSATLAEFNYFVKGRGYDNQALNAAILKLVGSTSNKVAYPQFIQWIKWTKAHRPQVIELFNRYSSKKVTYERSAPDFNLMAPLMSFYEFCAFLEAEQRHFPIDIQKILKKVSTANHIYEGVSVYVFARYLYSNTNNLFDPHLRRIYHDMGRPLNQYYCYSSHNTYLTGNQLNSQAALYRYIEDLQNGVRCVEIDVHDDLTNVKVTHGFTRTGKLNFQDVVRTLAKFSDYHPNHTPIMLSIEVHLHWRHKQVMVDILLHFLGRKLLLIEKEFYQYPTALELRNKILIKTRQKVSDNLKASISETEHKNIKQARFMKQSKEFVLRLFNSLEAIKPSVSQSNNNDNQMFIPIPIHDLKNAEPRGNTSFADINRGMSQLRQDSLDWGVVREWIMSDPMTCMNKITCMYKGVDHNHKPNFFEYINGDWRAIVRIARKEPAELVKFTSKAWCRVYPRGLEFFSSNFNPIRTFSKDSAFLEMGVQFISLNTQARETYRYIQHAHFSENCCGYLLKPKNLIAGGFVSQHNIQLAVKVAAAYNAKPRNSQRAFEYSVRMGFFGSVADCNQTNQNGSMRYVTETVKDPNATFEYSYVQTFELCQPYFAFLLFEVAGLGCTAVPVRCMRSGYRSVQLLDSNFKRIQGMYLLVWTNIAEHANQVQHLGQR